MIKTLLMKGTSKITLDNLYKVCYPNFKDTTKYLG
jgi:hypothetical protein